MNNVNQIKNQNSKKVIFLLKPFALYLFLLTIMTLPLSTRNKKVQALLKSEDKETVFIIREKDTGLIKPLLFVEIKEDEKKLLPIKFKVNEYLEQKKKEGIISAASVYLNNLNSGNRFEINPDELYDPASIMKVPLMLIYLSMEEENPGTLDKTILYSDQLHSTYISTIKSKSIQVGKNYTIKELLHYMIAYSDNDAMHLLVTNAVNIDFTKLCNDFDIPIKIDYLSRADSSRNFIANVNSISRFFRVLYNSTFLSRKLSQYALSLLIQSDYKDGILTGVNPDVKVAHKFGERFEGGVAQFHEFGIVYIDNNPYLLGVMTKGPNLSQLQEIISSVSKIVFDEMKNVK